MKKEKVKNKRKSSKKVWERMVQLSKATKSWELDFWQAQKSEMRFRVTWGLVVDSYRLRGKKIDESAFRLQRTVENIKRA